jgi:hypothetical protein
MACCHDKVLEEARFVEYANVIRELRKVLSKAEKTLGSIPADPTEDPVTIPITLTREEWMETVNAIYIRAVQLKREGHMDDMTQGDLKDWIDALANSYSKITKELDKFKINY